MGLQDKAAGGAARFAAARPRLCRHNLFRERRPVDGTPCPAKCSAKNIEPRISRIAGYPGEEIDARRVSAHEHFHARALHLLKPADRLVLSPCSDELWAN